MVDSIERSIMANGCEIHYLEAGPSGGRVVVLLHGMKFRAQTWQELGTLKVLAETGRRVIALDLLPGFGASPACSGKTIDILAAFFDKLNLEKIVLVGPSMGGRIALEFCLDYPKLISGLVLVGAVGVQENRERLSEIGVPSFIIWGGADSVSSIDHGRLLHEKIASSTFFVIDGAPHPCYLDQPELWHHELVSFLEKI